ncbi:MAG: LacI family transcriptional regulator [Armatimonadetes bacterium]|nr:LacI family transcriptional regulator [Armatimonadota bacterium]
MGLCKRLPATVCHTTGASHVGVTLQDVAAQAKVSVGTASRVLNGRCSPYVSAATKKAVFEAAARLGYRPNRIARALVTGRRNMIGLAVPYVGYPLRLPGYEVCPGAPASLWFRAYHPGR